MSLIEDFLITFRLSLFFRPISPNFFYALYKTYFSLANEPDELCASMYSFHSSPEEKNKLLFALTQHGIETTVDRIAKKKRIRDWIQESVILEDDEEEGDEDDEEISHRSRTPVAGHVSAVRADEKAARTQIVSTIKDASNKHINPRTGKIETRPSEMGHSGKISHHHHSSPFRERNDQFKVSHHHETSPFRERNDQSSPVNQSNHAHEMHKDKNDYEIARRSIKLVDVGSQTSSESQKQLEAANNARTYTPERSMAEAYAIKNSHSIPTISHPPAQYTKTQNTQTNLSRMDSTSRGFMSAYNSLAAVAIPEMHQTQQSNSRNLQPVSSKTHGRDQYQPRQRYQQRHSTTALSKQPISRSAHNFNSLVNDSGYGSLDKLRPNDGVNLLASPTLSKRSIIQSKLEKAPNGGVSNNELIHINGLSHSQTESGTPFHSDSGGGGSPRGSNGFVNYAGINNSTTATTTDTNNTRIRNDQMKDTAYDRVHSSRRKR